VMNLVVRQLQHDSSSSSSSSSRKHTPNYPTSAACSL
jgi:hypothetical protein